MVGRTAQGAPWVPALIAANLGGEAAPVVPGGAALGALVAEHYEDVLAEYGRDLGLRVARKHLGWYLDAADVPRGDILTLEDPARVLRRLASAFNEWEAA
jgi:tRNA-dihydrouridine synthase B